MIEKLVDVVHPPIVALTVKVDVIGEAVPLLAVNEGMFPLPEVAERPIDPDVRLQVTDAPGVELDKLIAPVVSPGQN